MKISILPDSNPNLRIHGVQVVGYFHFVALNYFAYNFIKIHRTLRTSPAMAPGVTDRL